jgi:hypothetical protein
MKQISGVVVNFGKIINQAKKQIIDSVQSGRIQSEPTITDRFLGILESEINQHGRKIYGKRVLTFRALTLTDRGKNSAESKFGADFAVILDIDVMGFKLQKGFLCQAKKEQHGIVPEIIRRSTTVIFSVNPEFQRLQNQVHNMLQITPDSFVMIYGKEEFLVIPASSIDGLYGDGSLYAKRVADFFMEFLMCFVGDQRINKNNPDHFASLMENAKRIIKIDIREEERKTTKKESPTPTDHLKIDVFSNEMLKFDDPLKIIPIISAK